MKTEGIEIRRALSLKELVFGILRFLPRLPAFCIHGFRLLALARKKQVSFLDVFERTVRKYPNRPAVTCERETITYRDLDKRADRVARVLSEKGIGSGDTVCVMMDAGADIITLFVALMKLDATAALVSPKLRGPSLIRSLSIPQFSEVRPVALLFTSGTTGEPKAVPVFHRRLVMSGVWYGRLLLGLRPSDILYCPLPFHHAAGIAMGWPAAVIAGASLAIPRRFSASGLMTDLRSTGATVLLYIGELLTYTLKAIQKRPIEGIRLRALLGTGLRAHLWPRVRTAFGNPRIIESYASTEAVGVFGNLLDLDGTVGVSFDTYLLARVKADTGEPIRSSEGRFERAGRGETGRLLYRVRGNKTPVTDEAAWFDTGDLLLNLGFGHAAFVDRIGNTYRWKGEIVSPREVESALLSSPQVRDVSVFGVVIPNTDGRAGAAEIATTIPANRLDVDALAVYLRRTLPDYAIPVFLILTDELKSTDTFKNRAAQRPELRELLDTTDGTLFVRLPGTSSFVPMDEQLKADIEEGIVF